MEEASERVLEDMERPAIHPHTVTHVVVDIFKQSPLQLDTENKHKYIITVLLNSTGPWEQTV